MQGTDQDSWEKPYKIIMGRIRQKTFPCTVSLPQDVLDRVLDNLFPRADPRMEKRHLSTERPCEGVPPNIEIDKLRRSIKRATKRVVTPSLNGIPGKILAIVSNFMQEEILELFQQAYFQQSKFPEIWKNAEIILISKPSKADVASSSTYRPICLISEVGKTFEKIIAERIWNHFERIGPNLSAKQYGFRKGRSAIDAIERVTSFAESSNQGWRGNGDIPDYRQCL